MGCLGRPISVFCPREALGAFRPYLAGLVPRAIPLALYGLFPGNLEGVPLVPRGQWARGRVGARMVCACGRGCAFIRTERSPVPTSKNTDRRQLQQRPAFFMAEKVEKSDQIKNWPKPEKVRKSDQTKSSGRSFGFCLLILACGLVEELLVDPHGASDRTHTRQAVDH